jgi:hypothetical protein
MIQVLKATMLDRSPSCFLAAKCFERGNQIGIGVPQRTLRSLAGGNIPFYDVQIRVIQPQILNPTTRAVAENPVHLKFYLACRTHQF